MLEKFWILYFLRKAEAISSAAAEATSAFGLNDTTNSNSGKPDRVAKRQILQFIFSFLYTFLLNLHRREVHLRYDNW